MRVVQVIDGLGTGGTERSLAELLPLLEDRGVEVTVCVRRTRAEGVEAGLRARGTDIRMLPGRTVLGQARALRAVVRAVRPDLVHTSLFGATLVARLGLLGVRVPLLTSIVSTPYEPVRLQHDPNLRPATMRLVRAVDRGLAFRTTHFHAVSNAARDSAVRHLGLRPERITVIERGRDEARLGTWTPERRASSRRALGVDPDALVVAAAGRHEFQKGHRFLLDAVARVVPKHPGLVVLVAGRDGNATPALRAQHDALGLGDHVRFLGHRDDVPDVLAAADVFVLPSVIEGIPGVAIEAMALGLPVVAFDVPPVRETVEPGVTALLAPCADAGALAGALDELLSDADRRRALGRAGRERFAERYTLDRCADRTLALYRAVTTA